MQGDKSLVVGYDNTEDLAAVLKCLNGSHHFTYNVITTGRVTDLIPIVNSVTPDLIIFYFGDNQGALNEYLSKVPNNDIPLLCITASISRPLTWNTGRIVFTYAARDIYMNDYFISTIHSIFLLKKATSETAQVSAGQMHYQPLRSEDLSRYVLELDRKTEVLSKVKERIAHLYPSVDESTRSALNSIVNAIKMSANDDNLWEDFKLYYEMNDPGFLLLLAQKHPELTARDLKYCCYLKMNMSNSDIRGLLGINQESVRTHKYRLKRKMLLAPDLDLRSYLLNVCQQ